MLPEKIKEYRLKNEWTQEDLATKMNVTRQTISKWEQGINEPDLTTIQKLCQVFHITLSELLDVVEKENKLPSLIKKLNYLSFGTFLFCFFSQLIFLVYTTDRIPMHYNSKGQIDRYGIKWEWLWMLSYYIVIFLMDWFVATLIKKEAKPQKSSYIIFVCFKLVMWLSQFLGLGIYLYFTVAFLKSGCFWAILMAELYLFLLPFTLFIHPRFTKKNTIYGVRTSFTLENEEGWNRVNSFSAYILSLFSLILLLLNMFIPVFWFNIWSSLGLGLGLGIIFFYHYYIKKKIEGKEVVNKGI